jgi:hypothetical protein
LQDGALPAIASMCSPAVRSPDPVTSVGTVNNAIAAAAAAAAIQRVFINGSFCIVLSFPASAVARFARRV